MKLIVFIAVVVLESQLIIYGWKARGREGGGIRHFICQSRVQSYHENDDRRHTTPTDIFISRQCFGEVPSPGDQTEMNTFSFSINRALWGNQRRWLATIRLSKRMSELDICSRREADRLIRAGHVQVHGEVAVIGQKVEDSLMASEIIISTAQNEVSYNSAVDSQYTRAVVLHKPFGYVSGQAEHGHPPAATLLTRDRLWGTKEEDIILPNDSWKGFAPAGRLDLESTGLLVFSHSGIISKKLISAESNIEKEYIAKVDPAVQATRRELELDKDFILPRSTLDLSALVNGHETLLGDARPLKPCKAKWLDPGSTLKIVLTEGRKRHIRRACRELLGFHVEGLLRTRIGPIGVDDLPEGCWRPLYDHEIEEILQS